MSQIKENPALVAAQEAQRKINEAHYWSSDRSFKDDKTPIAI